jgi:hypothetical protein
MIEYYPSSDLQQIVHLVAQYVLGQADR